MVRPRQCGPGARYTDPVFTYSPYTGGCSVIGGLVYRGQEYADLVGGTYIATDYCSSTVWALRPDGAGGYDQAEIGQMPTQVTAIGATVGRRALRGQRPARWTAPGVVRPEGTPTCRITHTTYAWGGGLTANLTLTNTGTAPVSGWTLVLPLALGQTIISDWNTDLVQNGDTVTAANAAYNGTIAPGDSVKIGYLANHTGDTSAPRDTPSTDTPAPSATDPGSVRRPWLPNGAHPRAGLLRNPPDPTRSSYAPCDEYGGRAHHREFQLERLKAAPVALEVTVREVMAGSRT